MLMTGLLKGTPDEELFVVPIVMPYSAEREIYAVMQQDDLIENLDRERQRTGVWPAGFQVVCLGCIRKRVLNGGRCGHRHTEDDGN